MNKRDFVPKRKAVGLDHFLSLDIPPDCVKQPITITEVVVNDEE